MWLLLVLTLGNASLGKLAKPRLSGFCQPTWAQTSFLCAFLAGFRAGVDGFHWAGSQRNDRLGSSFQLLHVKMKKFRWLLRSWKKMPSSLKEPLLSLLSKTLSFPEGSHMYPVAAWWLTAGVLEPTRPWWTYFIRAFISSSLNGRGNGTTSTSPHRES